MINRKIFCKSGPKLTIASSSEWERSARFGDWYFTRQSSNELHSTMYWGTSVYYLGMWWSQVKPASGGLGCCVSNPSDADLPRDHSLFCWTAIYRCLHILNTKFDDISRSHAAFNIIQTSRNSYSVCVCICLLLHGTRQTVMNDEWELYATNGVSKSDVNEFVNPQDFGSVQNCGILTLLSTDLFKVGFELRHEEGHARPGWTTSRRGQDSQWRSQSEWQRTEINGESASTVWPTLGLRTAKKTEQKNSDTSPVVPRSRSWCAVRSWRGSESTREAARRWRGRWDLAASTCRSCRQSADARLTDKPQCRHEYSTSTR